MADRTPQLQAPEHLAAAVDAAAAAHAWAAALFPGGGDDALDAAMRDFVVESSR